MLKREHLKSMKCIIYNLKRDNEKRGYPEVGDTGNILPIVH